MKPLEQVRVAVMMRLRRDTYSKLLQLGHQHGQRLGPFSVMLMETIAQCPPEKLHAALAQFADEAKRR
jgi:hypothetical protein